MPANPKHLEKSNWQRFAKVSAGILGGYTVSFLVHACFLFWFNAEVVFETATFSLFVLWIPLLLLPFFLENGWKCWLLYISIALACLLIICSY